MISIWYILILGELGKQNFFETFADELQGANALEEADARKKAEERNAERIKLEKELNLAKLSKQNTLGRTWKLQKNLLKKLVVKT